MITVAAFDLDGVVRHFDPAAQTAVERRHGLTEGSLGAAAFAPQLADDVLTGRMTRTEWMAATGQAVGSTAAAIEWLTQSGRIDKAMVQLVAELEAAGTTVVSATNATDTLHAELTDLNIANQIGRVFNSSELGFAKPSAEFFEAICVTLAIDPAAMYFVDDSLRNVTAACELGIDGRQFVDAARCRADLVALGLLPT